MWHKAFLYGEHIRVHMDQGQKLPSSRDHCHPGEATSLSVMGEGAEAGLESPVPGALSRLK